MCEKLVILCIIFTCVTGHSLNVFKKIPITRNMKSSKPLYFGNFAMHRLFGHSKIRPRASKIGW